MCVLQCELNELAVAVTQVYDGIIKTRQQLVSSLAAAVCVMNIVTVKKCTYALPWLHNTITLTFFYYTV